MSKYVITLVAFFFTYVTVFAQNDENNENMRHALLAMSDSLYALGVDLYNAGKYQEAIPIFTESDKIDNDDLNFTGNRSNYTAMWLASCYYNLGDTLTAEETSEYYDCVPVDRRLLVRADSLSEEGFVLWRKGDSENALNCFIQSAEIEKAVMGEEHRWYVSSLGIIELLYNNLAVENSSMGNYSAAIRFGIELLNVCEKVYGKEHPEYAQALQSLAIDNAYLGNYQEAIRLGTEALNIFQKVYGKAHPDYAQSLNNLANYNSSLGNYSDAIKLSTESLNVYEKVHDKESPNYAWLLQSLAVDNSSLGNYAEAIRLETEALNIFQKVYGKAHPDYALSLNNLASCNYYLGNYSEAIRLGTEALNIRGRVLGTEHPDYVSSLGNLARYYFYGRDIESTNYYSSQYSESASSLVKKTFAELTSSQRQQFWEMYKAWYEATVHRFSYGLPSDTLALNGYNGVLLSKGLLLNSDIEFSKLIQESGDSEALAMYENLKRTRTQVNKLREEFSSADSIKLSYLRVIVDSLSRESDRMEKDLVRRSKVYGDYTDNLVITWEQVQEKLTDKDIAVEFVSFPLNADSTMYIAYTLRKGWEYPRMIPLFEEKQLKKIYSGEYYTTIGISELVWKPLEGVLGGAEAVYFAPSGELYNIAIESVPDYNTNGESIVSDSRAYYRLSSTRELALKKDKDVWKEAAVYGGLKYGMTAEGLTADSRNFNPNGKEDITYANNELYNIADTLSMMRGGTLAELLPGTLIEAEAIDKSLETSGVSSTLYTDSIGTEASFKNLNGKKTSIMHIGTHGFYWTEKEARNLDYKFLMNDETSSRYVEDKQLTRSGLLFAGANYVLSGSENQLPEGVDDGILTAKELTTIDLRGLDLVVLSACQTGLGEITGDGVFGLQRGFKKAGAQTIVMSLWKVDDEATRLFMTKFFEEIRLDKEGHPTNKHEAFLAAQHYLRDEYEIEQTRTINGNLTTSQIRRLEREGKSVEVQTITEKVKPYAAPKYWAAFIMLDGIL